MTSTPRRPGLLRRPATTETPDASTAEPTATATAQTYTPPAYELSHTPDGTSYTVRENLCDILERELLGPLNGETELLERSPDTLYVIGRIAPVKLRRDAETGSVVELPPIPHLAPEHQPADEASTSDDIDADGVPFVTDADGPDHSQDAVDDNPQRRGLMIPASLGLRCCVPTGTTTVRVHSSWATYRRCTNDELKAYNAWQPDPDAPNSEHATRSGLSEDDLTSAPTGSTSPNQPAHKARQLYARTPHHKVTDLDLNTLVDHEIHKTTLKDNVTLRVAAYTAGDRDRILLDISLCNDADTPRPIPVDTWLFQTQLHVDSPDGQALFLPIRDITEPCEAATVRGCDPEEQHLALQYRERLEYAVGRTCSVDWTVPDPDARRATQVRTTWLPRFETPQTQAPDVPGALLNMRELATAEPEHLRTGLGVISDAYNAWLDAQHLRVQELPAHLQPVAHDALEDARLTALKLRNGIAHLLHDDTALRCFRFMNAVMADQRIHGQVAAQRAANPTLTLAQAEERIGADPKNYTWRTFQLAFILLNLEALSAPDHDDRAHDSLATVNLLFFPTGGGKTEAYLGLAAYTFALRRLQGAFDTADGRMDGTRGVAVLMRYTLRLLTSQQFQRATALICAAETHRRRDPHTWGDTPFRIGLWVGSEVSPKTFAQAEEQLDKYNQHRYGKLTVSQMRQCPWCGSHLDPGTGFVADKHTERIHLYCSNTADPCPFSRAIPDGEGLPCLSVDQEIYRLVPDFLVATVDKFARLAHEGKAAALFGYVRRLCPIHGFAHEDDSTCTGLTSHRGVTVRDHPRLRPPDLIIQDELHLISGALGTTVGVFERAVDVMGTWHTSHGTTAKPLIIASTATVRRAKEHVRALYGRCVSVFPPPVLDVSDNFFSQEVPVSRDTPGRRYLGVTATGVRATTANIRLSEVLLSAGQLLHDTDPNPDGGAPPADPYLTQVVYFNAIRELAGYKRNLNDEIATAIRQARGKNDLPKRLRGAFLKDIELTSRAAGQDVAQALDDLAITFRSAYDRSGLEQAGRRPDGVPFPADAVLATSMLQVGVDVSRLGLMVVAGQPKNTAEYIQASSRVGRDSRRPGLVIMLGNWARPRDLAHYEQFRHYHATFYSQVEPLSITPNSPTAQRRGADGMLLSTARVTHAAVLHGLSPKLGAGRIHHFRDHVEQNITDLVRRVEIAAEESANDHGPPDDTPRPSPAEDLRGLLISRLDAWEDRARNAAANSWNLSYAKATGREKKYTVSILAGAEDLRHRSATSSTFVAPSSMREVQPDINILITPQQENLGARIPDGVPAWRPYTPQDKEDTP